VTVKNGSNLVFCLAQPTAQASVAETALTPSSCLSPVPGLGMLTCDQPVPFQCKARVLGPKLVPTAQASARERALPPVSRAKLPGLGLGTRFQVVPFQCKVKDLNVVGDPVTTEVPAAQTLLPDAALTLLSEAPPVPGLGLGTRDQAVPFQCTIKVCPTL